MEQNIINQIAKISVQNIENINLIEKYLSESEKLGTPVTLFNWECPPRFIDKTDPNNPFVSFNVNLSELELGKKIDTFTEVPRVVKNNSDEVKILKYLLSLCNNIKFVKLIADTNVIFLYPESKAILGEELITTKIAEFKNLIIKNTTSYPVKTEVFLFWKLLKKYNLESIYIEAFNFAYNKLKSNNQKLIYKSIIKKQIKRTKNHIGIDNPEWSKEISLRTIASYGAEGIVFNDLSKNKELKNCIWMNIEEVDKRTIEITNFLRKFYKLESLPMIFPNIKGIENKANKIPG